MTTYDSRPALFDGIGPEMYRRNAFRVLGLRVDATGRAIRQQADKLRVAMRYGVAGNVGRTALPLDPPPDLDAVQEAERRLHDPEQRLTDEIFWFWPLDRGAPGAAAAGPAGVAADGATAALERGDVDGAVAEWQRSESVAARHNLAVLALVRALDHADAARTWKQAIQRWRAVLDDPEFWGRVEASIDDIDDARLSPYTDAPMRAALATGLLSINAALAVEAARRGDRPEADRQVALVRNSGYGETLIESVLARAVESDAARVRTLCEHAEQAAGAAHARGAEAARDLLDQAASPLQVLSAVLSDDHPILEGARDKVAGSARLCSVLGFNETTDARAALDILTRVSEIAATPAMRDRIARDVTTVRAELVYLTCWFCAERPALAGAAYEQKIYGDVQRQWVPGGTRVTWRKATVNVPRCAECDAAHKSRAAGSSRVGCLVPLGLAAGGIAAIVGHIPGLGFGLLVLAAIVWFVASTMSQPREVRARASEFPAVREQLQKGWSLGEKPPT